MVEFCGWSMPVQYTQSVMESTKHCRSKALLFDVSHMCGLSLKVIQIVKRRIRILQTGQRRDPLPRKAGRRRYQSHQARKRKLERLHERKRRHHR